MAPPLLWRRRRQTGIRFFGGGAGRRGSASLEEAQADGDDHENGNDLSKADAEDGSVVVSYESELDEISDSGRSEWDEEESVDEEGIMLLKPTLNPKSGHRM